MRELLFNLGLGAFEKALGVGKEIQATLRKSGDLTKDTRRELTAQLREQTQAAQLFARDARARSGGGIGQAAAAGGRLLGRASNLLERFGRARAIGKTLENIGGADQDGQESDFEEKVKLVGSVARFAGPVGQLVAQAIQLFVLPFLKKEREITQHELDARDAILLMRAKEEQRTFEERLRDEPGFAASMSRLAYREHMAERAAVAGRGLAGPAADQLDFDGGY